MCLSTLETRDLHPVDYRLWRVLKRLLREFRYVHYAIYRVGVVLNFGKVGVGSIYVVYTSNIYYFK